MSILGFYQSVEEIAGAVYQQPAKAVALSLVYPADDLSLSNELRTLHRQLPAQVALLVGGRAAQGYRKVLEAIGATLVLDLPRLRIVLAELSSHEHEPRGTGTKEVR